MMLVNVVREPDVLVNPYNICDEIMSSHKLAIKPSCNCTIYFPAWKDIQVLECIPDC